ncbi:MAG: hypothetical protein RJQ05_10055 [Cytophagales bacterium]
MNVSVNLLFKKSRNSTFDLMNKAIRHVISIFFCGLILVAQGGFFQLHEHSLEVLSHQCSHDGEHDQSYDELCSICEIHATFQFDINLPLTFVALKFVNGLYTFDQVQESSESFFQLNNRGPPSIS